MINPVTIAPRLLRWAVAVSIGIAALFVATDLDEGIAWRNAVQKSIAGVREMAPDANIWYAGHWGIDYYAPKLGARPIIPDNTTVKKGEWMVLFIGVHRPTLVFPPDAFDVYVLPANYYLPWSMKTSFYSGDAPIEWREGENRVWMLQARSDVPIQSSQANGNMIEVIEHRRQYTPDAALPGVMTKLKQLGGEDLIRARRAIEGIGPRGLIYTLEHAEPENRAWAATRLGEGKSSVDVVNALQAAAADPDERVRKAATGALQKRKGGPAGKASDRSTRE